MQCLVCAMGALGDHAPGCPNGPLTAVGVTGRYASSGMSAYTMASSDLAVALPAKLRLICLECGGELAAWNLAIPEIIETARAIVAGHLRTCRATQRAIKEG